jgi:hypothetical protein
VSADDDFMVKSFAVFLGHLVSGYGGRSRHLVYPCVDSEKLLIIKKSFID